MSSTPQVEFDWQQPAACRRLTVEHSEDLRADAFLPQLTGNRLLTAQAMKLLMRVDRDIREARAQFNQDWFRRLMRVRKFAVGRLRRRWTKVDPSPLIPLGQLRRRSHANIAYSLYR